LSVIHFYTLDGMVVGEYHGRPVAVLSGFESDSRIHAYNVAILACHENNSRVIGLRVIHVRVSDGWSWIR
jgi:hypothetical protein